MLQVHLLSKDFSEIQDSTYFYTQNNDFKTALHWSNKLIGEAEIKFGKKDTNYTTAIFNHANILRKLKMYDSAITWLEYNISYLDEIYPKEHLNKIFTRMQLGVNYESKNNYIKAENYYLSAFKMCEDLKLFNHEEYGEVIYRIALLNRNMSKMDSASKYFSLGYNAFKNIYPNDHDQFALFIGSYANFFRLIGNYKEAEEHYLKAIDMMNRMHKEPNRDYAVLINNLGAFYFFVGNYEKSIIKFNESLEIFLKNNITDKSTISFIYHNLALIHFILKDYELSDSLFNLSIPLRRESNNKPNNSLAQSLKGQADLYAELGRFDEAEKLYLEAIDIRRKIFNNSHPDLANAINSLGSLYIVQESKRNEAINCFFEAHKINSEYNSNYHLESLNILSNVALGYEALGEIEKAYSLFSQLINNTQELIGNYLPSIPETDKNKYYLKASRYINNFNSFALRNFKKLPKIKNQLTDIQIYTKGLMLNESTRMKDLVLSNADSNLHQQYYYWLNLRGSLSKHYTFSKIKLENENSEIEKLKFEVQETEKKLLNQIPFLNNYHISNIINWQSLFKQNKDDVAAINVSRVNYFNPFTRLDSSVYIFMVMKSSVIYPEIIVINAVDLLENEYLQKYKDELISNEKNKQSYNNYWAFLEPYLKGIKKIYFSPDGVYNKINVNVLQNPKTKRYLEDDFEIVQLTSLKDMLKSKIDQNKDFVLFGNPTYNNDELLATNKNKFEIDSIDRSAINLIPLPSSEIEINEISNILKKKNLPYKTYVGLEASEVNLKKVVNPKVLHLSTHGYFLRDIGQDSIQKNSKVKTEINPLLRSMLFLSKSNNFNNELDSTKFDDGVFTGLEAQNLSLYNTELVVLAACETGLGEIKNGEGVYGLQRAIIQAGAQSLIMSLWKVNDKATKDLMINFYKEWLSGKTKTEAFKIAKNKLKIKYNYPLFWGAFIMIGE